MRAAIFAAMMGLGLPAFSVAQEPVESEQPRTKLEAFMVQEGVVILRASSRVGELSDEFGARVVFESKEFTNAGSGERAHGITVEVRKADRLGTSYVDLDEIPSLISALEYIGKIDRTATSLDRLEAEYRTKGGLVVAMRIRSGATKVAVSSGAAEMTTAYLDFGDLERMRQLVLLAHEGLKALTGNER